VLPYRATSFALVCAVAFGLSGCGSAKVFDDKNEGGWFSKPVDLFAKPDWARPADAKGADLGPQGPVGAEELVNADGSCSPEAGQAAATPADRPVGSPAGDLAGAPMPAASEGGMPPVLGGIALGMTECQAVRRAGSPGNVAISADDKGERKVVLTYLSGPWPGIYTFSAGRLKIVDRAPEPPKPVKPVKPVKPAPKKKQPAKPRVSQTR
jgi:hypothetical protein